MTGRLRHLQDGFRIAEPAVVSAHGLHQRSVYLRIHLFTLSGEDHGIRCPLAAVSDRYTDRLTGAKDFMRCFREKFNSLLTGDSSFERI